MRIETVDRQRMGDDELIATIGHGRLWLPNDAMAAVKDFLSFHYRERAATSADREHFHIGTACMVSAVPGTRNVIIVGAGPVALRPLSS